MDIKKLYPSIKKDRSDQLVYNEVLKTKVDFKNVNYPMALRFIAKSAKLKEEVDECGFKEWCLVRTKTWADAHVCLGMKSKTASGPQAQSRRLSRTSAIS